MQWLRPYISLLVCILPVFGLAQAIDNTGIFRNISSDHYFRINYENDFFSGTDREYTQGIYIEKVTPSFRRFFLSKLLWHPRNGLVKYGIAIEHEGYTPNYIDRPEIQAGDRPYAGAIFLKTFQQAINAGRGERVTSLLSTGLIGPAAGGEGMQRAIHHWINYTQPQGWHNQIRNDLVMNYQLNYEKEFLSYGDHLSLSTYGSLRLGTLNTKATTGLTLMAGNFYSPFGTSGALPVKKIQWYFYDQPLVNVVGYDATLQGGLFNRSSPYTISNRDMSRLTFQNKYGFIVILRHLYLEYYQTSITKEFRTSAYHGTGGLQIGFGF
ncbi:MAG TPA: lipid A deacylase LpxR family protein [Puia sp.]|nr:lipid A deacylase LpxR family protein [Puia sp.]